MRPTSHNRLDQIEATLQEIAAAQARADAPRALRMYLGELSAAQVAAVAQLARLLEADGLELRIGCRARFSRAEIQAMTPRERAEAYRVLIQGEPAPIAGGRHA